MTSDSAKIEDFPIKEAEKPSVFAGDPAEMESDERWELIARIDAQLKSLEEKIYDPVETCQKIYDERREKGNYTASLLSAQDLNRLLDFANLQHRKHQLIVGDPNDPNVAAYKKDLEYKWNKIREAINERIYETERKAS